MKRAGLLSVCLFLGLNSGAFAFDTVEDAYAAMTHAGHGLSAQAEDALRGEDADLAASLQAFSETAAEARDTMDALEGPTDLRCIFNGMAADAAKRAEDLAQAEDAAARTSVLEDIVFLGEDAVLVTPETEADNAVLAGLPPMTCAASTEPVQAADLAALLSR